MKRMFLVIGALLLPILIVACGDGRGGEQDLGGLVPITTEVAPTAQDPEQPVALISKADLNEGSDVARRISFNLLSAEELSAHTGLEYTTLERWNDWDFDPQDSEFSEALAAENLMGEREIRETLFESGYLRRLTKFFDSETRGEPCQKLVPAHELIIDILVFASPEGARSFFQKVLVPSDPDQDEGSYYASANRQEIEDCRLPAPPPTPCCNWVATTTSSNYETSWFVQGPFVLSAHWFSVDFKPDPVQNTLRYLLDQTTELREEFPAYFPE